jgi:hypothetical protein
MTVPACKGGCRVITDNFVFGFEPSTGPVSDRSVIGRGKRRTKQETGESPRNP